MAAITVFAIAALSALLLGRKADASALQYTICWDRSGEESVQAFCSVGGTGDEPNFFAASPKYSGASQGFNSGGEYTATGPDLTCILEGHEDVAPIYAYFNGASETWDADKINANCKVQYYQQNTCRANGFSGVSSGKGDAFQLDCPGFHAT
jgi:hypothetical protein